jgi:hypothetical protein
MFEAFMREVAWEALVVLQHEEDEQMEHSQYRQFPNRAEEGAKAMVLPTGDHDCMPPFFWVFFISSILILQMANNAENNGGSNNQEANPPPPPLLTLEQVLAMLA